MEEEIIDAYDYVNWLIWVFDAKRKR